MSRGFINHVPIQRGLQARRFHEGPVLSSVTCDIPSQWPGSHGASVFQRMAAPTTETIQATSTVTSDQLFHTLYVPYTVSIGRLDPDSRRLRYGVFAKSPSKWGDSVQAMRPDDGVQHEFSIVSSVIRYANSAFSSAEIYLSLFSNNLIISEFESLNLGFVQSS
jgi:hypothetical protein